MRTIIDYLKKGYAWACLLVSILLVVVGAYVCVLISGPATAIASGLGVWATPAFIYNVWRLVAYGAAEAKNGIVCSIIGAIIGVLLCLLFV